VEFEKGVSSVIWYGSFEGEEVALYNFDDGWQVRVVAVVLGGRVKMKVFDLGWR